MYRYSIYDVVMIHQLSLGLGVIEQKKKIRIRYKVPNYLKFYSLWQYDRDAFRELLKQWLATEEGKNRTLETLKAKQNEILARCYLLDNDGNRLRDSDEPHIYRIKTLHSILREIYLNVVFFNTNEINELNIDYEEQTAEIKGTEWGMSIKERVLIHIKLLRLLRKGLSIKESIKLIKKGE